MTVKIAFSMEGNMGSILLRTNFVKKFVSMLPRDKVDVTIFGHPNMEITDSIFKDLDFVDHIKNRKELKSKIYKNYDLVLKLDTFPIVLFKSKILYIKSKKCYKIATKFEDFADNNKKWISDTAMFRPIIYQLAKMRNKNCVNCIDFNDILRLERYFIYTIKVPQDITNILSKWKLKQGEFITLNRGSYTIPGQGEGTRVWPLEYYNKLVKLLKETYPNVKLVQLGQTEDCPKIEGCDLYLCGKTNLQELKCLLYGAILHIDGEGGMVHLRKAMDAGASVVLFGGTDAEYFGHGGNINLRSDVCPYNCCEMHDCWIRKCLLSGNENPLCLMKLKPETVLEEIKYYLTNHEISKETLLKCIFWPGTKKLISDERFKIDYDWVNNWLRFEKINGYEFVKVCLNDLKYWKQIDENGNGKIVPLAEKENPAIAFNNKNVEVYNSYNKLKAVLQNDNFHSQERYNDLISELNNVDYDVKRGIITIDSNNIIMDGWHRASYLLAKYGSNYEIFVVKLDKKYFKEYL
ncbi:MAG: glycosyltransferase family 9 protein [Alphaproteobacteria bacterium]